MQNLDRKTVAHFGKEWTRFSYQQRGLTDAAEMFDSYFGWLGDSFLNATWKAADFGCGSGRWAKLVAPHVRELWCVDASEGALAVAKTNLSADGNCCFQQGVIGNLALPSESFDFCYSLGVLHHIPDTEKALRDCVRTLKRGGPFLVYLYYALDNRPTWFRVLWRAADFGRKCVAVLPYPLKVVICDFIAVMVYWPLSRLARFGYRMGRDISNWPLSFYRDRSLYVLRTDALDRFGTRLEKRFSKAQIQVLMEKCGLERIRFSVAPPYWVAIGWKA